MITKLKYGNTNTYFIRGKNGGLLIDTDYAGTLPAFFKVIKKKDIAINDITYVLATHYHPDHIGIVSELMKLGIKLLLIDIQYEYVHFSDEIFKRDRHLIYEPIMEKDAFMISCEKSREFLLNLGIEGEIISTASHSKDSISVILDDGDCIVGDLEPINYVDAYENNLSLRTDWELVMSYAPKTIHYAHVGDQYEGSSAAGFDCRKCSKVKTGIDFA